MMQRTMTPSLKNKTITSPASVLIVAKSDPTRDSLRILLETKPWINIVAQTDDKAKVPGLIKQHQPTLVILDTNVCPDSLDWLILLAQIQAAAPQTRCLVLTDTIHKQQLARESRAHGSLIKGYSAEKLFEAITELTLTR
jgi:DNA-binding NarL/FixJ family response regulator